MSRSTKRFVFLNDFFFLTYVYVFSLLLSLENMYGTMPCFWDSQ